MSHIATPILDVIKAHPEWAMVLIALTAFGESLLFGEPALSGNGRARGGRRAHRRRCSRSLPVIAAGIFGGILGDAASFWLGQKFGGALPKLWPFRGKPDRI